MKLGRDLQAAVIAIVVFTLVLGIGYPLVITGISQVAFPNKADGSLVTVDGKVIGSRLIGASKTLDKKPDPKYFQPRPSATGYSATATYFSNRGPNAKSAKAFYVDALAAYLKLNGTYDPGLSRATVPVDAVTTSASGVDPDISQANARIQAHRIAAVRHLPMTRVMRLVGDSTDGRFLGLIGEAGVNVTELNVALDKEASTR